MGRKQKADNLVCYILEQDKKPKADILSYALDQDVQPKVDILDCYILDQGGKETKNKQFSLLHFGT